MHRANSACRAPGHGPRGGRQNIGVFSGQIARSQPLGEGRPAPTEDRGSAKPGAASEPSFRPTRVFRPRGCARRKPAPHFRAPSVATMRGGTVRRIPVMPRPASRLTGVQGKDLPGWRAAAKPAGGGLYLGINYRIGPDAAGTARGLCRRGNQARGSVKKPNTRLVKCFCIAC